jgi:hypothetical protein
MCYLCCRAKVSPMLMVVHIDMKIFFPPPPCGEGLGWGNESAVRRVIMISRRLRLTKPDRLLEPLYTRNAAALRPSPALFGA